MTPPDSSAMPAAIGHVMASPKTLTATTEASAGAPPRAIGYAEIMSATAKERIRQ